MDTLPPLGDLSAAEGSGVAEGPLQPRAGLVLAERFELVEPLGRGASGWVWKAKHTIIRRHFAIKLLAPRTGTFDEDAAARMLREAKTLSSLDHPNVIAVSDFGHAPGGTPFIVMELLEGEPLRTVLDAGRLTWRDAKRWALQFLDGVEAAHREGIVHRDLKPANVFVCAKDRRIKVLDFGLARAPVVRDPKGRVTAVGEIHGTPATMSPEQIAGEDVDARSDVYSVGCVLYEMLAGRPAVQGEPAEILYQHVYGEPPALHGLVGDEVPGAVVDAVHRCLHKSPEQRPSLAEVRAAFAAKRVVTPSAPAPVPRRWTRGAKHAVVAAGVAAGALFGLVAARGPQVPAVEPISLTVPVVAAAPARSPALQAELPVFERIEATPRPVAAPPPPPRPRPAPTKAKPSPTAAKAKPSPAKPAAVATASPEPKRPAPKAASSASAEDRFGLKDPFSNLP